MCQGAAATVVRQNRRNASGCQTLRLLRNRSSLPEGTPSVGYLTKLLESTFNEAQLEEQLLQGQYDINPYEKDNGTALPDGVKIAMLLNKAKGALQQHLQIPGASRPNPEQNLRPLGVERKPNAKAEQTQEAMTLQKHTRPWRSH